MPDKFKGMSRRELAGYVWDYYKFHIIGAVIAAIMAGSLINAIFINPAAKAYVSVIVYGEQIEGGSIIALEALLNDAVVPEELKPRYAAVADNFYQSSNPQVNMAMTQKFAALMVVGELDIIIATRGEIDGLEAEGTLKPGQSIGLEGSKALAACGITLTQPAAGVAYSGDPEIAARVLDVLSR